MTALFRHETKCPSKTTILSWNKMLCLVTICQHVVQFSVLMSAQLNTPAAYRLTGLKRKKNPLVCAEVYIKESDSYQSISTKLTVSLWIVLKPCPPKYSSFKRTHHSPSLPDHAPDSQDISLLHCSTHPDAQEWTEHTQRSSTPHISELGSSLKITVRSEKHQIFI